MKQIILGTAGHIDHGKTSLIRAITGVNTDRLKEEIQRGITIELGFAPLDLPNGQHLGIVDVPGHEKFVKNMVAGATGIDIVAMVIAADEGVMPQTREHLEICTLLGVRHGLVVLTKIDMVDEEWLELVQEDIREFVRGTFLEGAPIVPVSSVSGEGIPRFVGVLEELTADIPERPPSSIFRLPVDRVFTMKGFGTVITGTLVSGRVRVGDPVVIFPSGIKSKVRGIQMHNDSLEEAAAGMRTAINFQGLEKEVVNRGDVVSSPGALTPSYMVDVSFRYLASNKKALKSRTQVRFHTGTSEVFGNLVVLGSDEIEPGATAMVQVRLESPVALVKGDRFVARSYSPVRTIGGGQILNPIPPKHKRFRSEIVSGLESLIDASPEETILHHTRASGFRGLTFSELRLMTSLPDKTLESALQGMLSRQVLIQVDKETRTVVHRETFDKLQSDITGWLTRFHQSFPLKGGMSKEEIKSKFPSDLGVKLFNLGLNGMISDGTVLLDGDSVRLADHRVALGQDQAKLREQILAAYDVGGLMPPTVKDLIDTLGLDPASAKELLRLLVDEGRLVKVKEDLYFPADAIDMLKQRLVEFLSVNGELTTPQFKDLTGTTRKYTIPLIEHFDATNVTIRIGDSRKLRKQS